MTTTHRSNTAVARRLFEEVWNGKRDDLIDELYDPACVSLLEGWELEGPDEFRAMRSEILESFPDLQLEIRGVLEDGENVAVRWIATATHQGEGFGLSASGGSVQFRGMTWLTFRDGRIIKSWDSWNLNQVIQELLYSSPGDTGIAAGLKLLRQPDSPE